MKAISSKDIRNKRMEYIGIMDEIKPVKLLPMLDIATLTMVAEYFETEYSVVSGYYSGHQKELEEYGIIKMKTKDFANAGYSVDPENIRGCNIVKYGDCSARVTSVGARCMSKAAIFNMALGLGRSEIADKIRAAVTAAENEAIAANEDAANNVENMAENILTFTNMEFGSIRVMEIGGQPWFVGKDVAESLGYGKGKSVNNAVAKHVDDEDKGVTEMMTPGGKQKTVIINESGLYSLIMSSKLPGAKQFKKWVTSEILPSVRKHGAYMTPETLTKSLQDPASLIVLLEILKSEQEKNRELSLANKAMSDEINTWDEKSMINALIRSYAANCLNGNFANAFAEFYREFDYKFHTKLKNRKTGKKSLLDCLSKEEISKAMKLAVAFCESRGINTGKVINEVNAATHTS